MINFLEYSDREVLVSQVTQTLASDLSSSIEERRNVIFSVPGGSTPGPIFDKLCEFDLDWKKVSIVLNDERWVPENSERSNTKLLRERLLIKNASDAKEQIDAYDTGIKYADFYLSKVFEDLKKMNLWDDTAIIISADHGENQGELNVWGDHQTADHITNRVPLIIRWPGITDTNKGSTVENKFYNLDLTSTISQITSSSQPDRWDGINFTENLTNSKSSNGRDYLVISHGAWSCQRSVRWDNWLLIRTYDTGLKDFPKYMLFDIEKDPHELNNLADQHKDLVAHGMFLIDEWIEENMYEADRGDPLQGVIREGGPHHANIYSKVWNTYVERLEKTDRKKHADNLRKYKGKPFSK